ncbi:MAG TPA: methyltransferase domain-containing protein [Terriglobia bacterium]|nr:methyltransferase domain-containing protein [Terriglobia bacterium]
MTGAQYVHGYSGREAARLRDQADVLSALLHEGIAYARGRQVLEAGCGTGAQTVHLASSSPKAEIVSIDFSEKSIRQARRRVDAAGCDNVRFNVADLYGLPFEEESFDDAFLCFVLEHLTEPERALAELKRVLRPGGTITVIEGDHGSWYCHPQTERSWRTVQCLIEVQRRLGGDARIGRRLYPLLAGAGFADVRVLPRMVYVDDSLPELVEGFSKNTFIAMVEGVREQALELGLMNAADWDAGIQEMYRAASPGGTFCYTFFRGHGSKNEG